MTADSASFGTAPNIADSLELNLERLPEDIAQNFEPAEQADIATELLIDSRKLRRFGSFLLQKTVVSPARIAYEQVLEPIGQGMNVAAHVAHKQVLKPIGQGLDMVVGTPYRAVKGYETSTMTGSIVKGAILGVPDTLVDYKQTLAQTGRDTKEIVSLERARAVELKNSGQRESFWARTQRKVGKAALIGWYVAPLPAYQGFDDTVTYPLYLAVHDKSDMLTAYGVAGIAGLSLAAGMGLVHRYVEQTKAKLRHSETKTDESDHFRRLLDASVNSAPWQVAVAAGQRDAEDGTVGLVSKNHVVQYAAAYALMNTALYAGAESLPVGEWTGFGLSLAAVWTLGGMYAEVKDRIQSHPESAVARTISAMGSAAAHLRFSRQGELHE